MKRQSAHEPDAEVMPVEDIWDDARQLAEVLHKNLLNAESVFRPPIPFSILLSTLDELSRDELMLLHQRVEERLTADTP